MNEIKSGLTGDMEHDSSYLIDKLHEYRDDREISSEIAEIALSYLSEETLESLDDELISNREKMHDSYEKAFQLAEMGLYQQAYDVIDDIAQEILPLDFYIHGNNLEFRSFSESFERDLYIEFEHPSVPVQPSPFPCEEIFVLHGSILLALGRIEEAITSLAVALLWNPVSHDAAVMLSEAYKLKNDDEMLLTLTMNSFRYAFRLIHLAELYYNLGYAYAKMERWDDAACCFVLSRRYGGGEIASSAQHQIERHLGRKLQEPDEETVRQCAMNNGFPLGPDPEIIQLAREIGMEYYTDGDYEGAQYYYEIAYELSGDENDSILLSGVTGESPLM
ncbi:MAG: hypothetical protein IJ242_13985 [Clostridia bacterium]|nr:hypothetical protein [Clostridia bacterium]